MKPSSQWRTDTTSLRRPGCNLHPLYCLQLEGVLPQRGPGCGLGVARESSTETIPPGALLAQAMAPEWAQERRIT